MVPGRRDWRAAVGDTDLVESVTDLAGRAVRVSSVCAGAFVLAATGLLDGRRAATHWELAPDLAVAFPEVRVESDPVFVRDGHVVTSAGVTAGIDLALSLVEEDCGAEVARSVARQLVVFRARPGGQAQFSARMVPGRPRHSAVRHVMDHVGSDPSAAHTLDSLAAVGGVSVRHLARLFRSEIGMSPGQYVESIRTEAAQALLENGDGTVEEVAQQAGFGSSEVAAPQPGCCRAGPRSVQRLRFGDVALAHLDGPEAGTVSAMRRWSAWAARRTGRSAS
ncbi:GlxA family transcriptional regulator [Streptomyces cellulosae]|uniref:GlxA family transcriptional regulator n=1 Tax=Streptomyces cellulosae TaxID=1968 RepID=A0ABW7YIE6_STRCE